MSVCVCVSECVRERVCVLCVCVVCAREGIRACVPSHGTGRSRAELQVCAAGLDPRVRPRVRERSVKEEKASLETASADTKKCEAT